LRQPYEALPLLVLAPQIGVAAPDDVLSLLPVVADRREEARAGIECHRPEIERYWLARLQVATPIERHAAVLSAVVLPVRRDHVMIVERIPRVPVAVVEPELGRYRIGLHVHP